MSELLKAVVEFWIAVSYPSVAKESVMASVRGPHAVMVAWEAYAEWPASETNP